MVVFDLRTLRVLWCISRNSRLGITWDELLNLYPDFASKSLLENLTLELYILTETDGRQVTAFGPGYQYNLSVLRAYITPKGRELLERRFFDFFKFVIPLIISVLALAVSAEALRLQLLSR